MYSVATYAVLIELQPASITTVQLYLGYWEPRLLLRNFSKVLCRDLLGTLLH